MLALLVAGGAWWSAHQAQGRVEALEQQLVARQQQSQTEATEALVMARAAQDAGREAAAKVALMEARLAEVALQRSQLEDLLQALSRSREENVLADLDAAVRVSLQLSALTGSVEPLLQALRQADERLVRQNQPRLERVRRAVLRDMERVRAAGVTEVPTLVIRLDETARQIDELPLLANAGASTSTASAASPAATTALPAAGTQRAVGVRPAEAAASGASGAPASPWSAWLQTLPGLGSALWAEVRSLVRVTRIDRPEAALIAPEQAFFLRQNLKLRLLNARLALLSRQFDVASADLQDAQRALERYFDVSNRRVALVQESLRQVAAQSRTVQLPRPDETLAALAAVGSGR